MMKRMLRYSSLASIPFAKKGYTSFKEEFYNNYLTHKTHIKNIGKLQVPDPKYGDMKLNVHPFEHTGDYVKLPPGFEMWNDCFNDILKEIPLQEGVNTHYVTIDSKYFQEDEYQRREGIHIDGNFCMDPYFVYQNYFLHFFNHPESKPDNLSLQNQFGMAATWGGIRLKPPLLDTWARMRLNEREREIRERKLERILKREERERKLKRERESSEEPLSKRQKTSEKVPSTDKFNSLESLIDFCLNYQAKDDNSHVEMSWKLPSNVIVPVGTYVSEHKGGILTASSQVGCQAWLGEYHGCVLSEGDYSDMADQLTDRDKIVFDKNNLYFMTSNTPHETILQKADTRRSFIRITLNHNYDNSVFKKKTITNNSR